MEVIEHVEIVARKHHKCNFCLDVIHPGERYIRQFCKDHTIYIWKAHDSCYALAMKLDWFDECDDEGLSTDSFRECVRTEYFALKGSDYDSTTIFSERIAFVKAHHKIVVPSTD